MQDGLPPIPIICAICQSPRGEVQHTLPLCTACREKHLKFVLPTFLKIGAALVGLVLLCTAVRLPSELEASIVWDRGQAAWDAKNYAEAEKEYKAALEYFPQSSSILGKVARAARASGDMTSFGSAMDQLAKLGKTDSEASREIFEVLMEGTPRKP